MLLLNTLIAVAAMAAGFWFSHLSNLRAIKALETQLESSQKLLDAMTNLNAQLFNSTRNENVAPQYAGLPIPPEVMNQQELEEDNADLMGGVLAS